MNDKIYLKELKHWDGEKYVTLDMIGITEQTITVVVTDAGKITVREYDLYEDNNGVFFERRSDTYQYPFASFGSF